MPPPHPVEIVHPHLYLRRHHVHIQRYHCVHLRNNCEIAKNKNEGFSGFLVDKKAVRVQNIFLDFLDSFRIGGENEVYYEAEIEAIVANKSTTMFMNVSPPLEPKPEPVVYRLTTIVDFNDKWTSYVELGG